MDVAVLVRTVVLMLIAYLAGSIPVGVVVARLAGGTDPRTIGSGRTGGTNALRALGRKWAAVVVGGDLLKGALPVLIARVVTDGDPLTEVLCGGAAVAGAIWSIFAGFRSGRGVGTGVGTMLVIQPIAVLLAAPVFILVILLTRYVSLGSLLGSAAMLPAMLLIFMLVPETPLPYVIYAAVGAAFIWLAHADNIDRLLHGTERKIRPGPSGGQAPQRLNARRPRRARESIDPGRLTARVGITLVRRAVGRPAPRGLWSAAAHAPEAVAAVDRLAAGRTERDLGFLAAVRARGREHLAGTAVARAVAAAVTPRGVTAAGPIAAI